MWGGVLLLVDVPVACRSMMMPSFRIPSGQETMFYTSVALVTTCMDVHSHSGQSSQFEWYPV